LSAASILLDENDKLLDDVSLVVILAVTELSELSMLDEEIEMVLELAFIVVSVASTLLDEFERLKLET